MALIPMTKAESLPSTPLVNSPKPAMLGTLAVLSCGAASRCRGVSPPDLLRKPRSRPEIDRNRKALVTLRACRCPSTTIGAALQEGRLQHGDTSPASAGAVSFQLPSNPLSFGARGNERGRRGERGGLFFLTVIWSA